MADTIAAKQRNEAAERLLNMLRRVSGSDRWQPYVDEALAAERRAYFDELLVAGLIAPKGLTYEATKQATERLTRDIADVSRRATVERIRARLRAATFPDPVRVLGGEPLVLVLAVEDILDEESKAPDEAARSQGSEA